MVEIAEKDDLAPPQGGGRIRQEPPTREYPKACALVFKLTLLRNLQHGSTQGKNDWLRKLTPCRVAVTEMEQRSVEERFVICCLLLVANKLGLEKWQRNTAARKLFVLNVALVTNSKIVPPKTILRNI